MNDLIINYKPFNYLQIQVKERHMKDTTLAIFFRHYEPLSESGKAQSMANIRQLIKDGAYENAVSMKYNKV